MKGLAILLGAFFGIAVGVAIGYFVLPMLLSKANAATVQHPQGLDAMSGAIEVQPSEG